MAETLPVVGAYNWGDRNNAVLAELQGQMTLSGTGSPESVVTATVGRRYIDTNATNGAVEWIKATGTGNTGWKVAYGDTGWRSVAGLFASGVVTGGTLTVRRTPYQVEYGFNGLSFTGAGNYSYSAPIAAGFRPFSSAVKKISDQGGNLVVYGDGNFTLTVFGNGGLYDSLVLPTSDAWPITLPGTAA